MLPSASILLIENQSNGIEKLQYLSALKQIFIIAAGALTTLGNANGAAILAQTNQLSNQEFAYQDSIDPIWTNFGNALVALGQNTYGNNILTYLNQSGRQQILWIDQIAPLISDIQKGLAALGQ